jgi:DNA-binding response OmpR family regulator
MKPLLIIEDEARTAQNVQKGLAEQGYQSDWAEDGQLGINLLSKSSYELVILDVKLPEKDGINLDAGTVFNHSRVDVNR